MRNGMYAADLAVPFEIEWCRGGVDQRIYTSWEKHIMRVMKLFRVAIFLINKAVVRNTRR